MRIGLDFDNTIACYDHVFAEIAEAEKLLLNKTTIGKEELKRELVSQKNGEQLWMYLQSQVYGPYMSRATLFPGVAQFLIRARCRGDRVFVVSHKTEFAHFDKSRTRLRDVALKWMKARGFFDPLRFALEEQDVFFSATREEKISTLATLSLDVFIDDLEEVLADVRFPPIRRVLFSRNPSGEAYDLHCDNWTAVARNLFGPITSAEAVCFGTTLYAEEFVEAQPVLGHRNNRVYRVESAAGKRYALKIYPDLLVDPRPRLESEITACKLLGKLGRTPNLISYDQHLNIALFKWIDGAPPNLVNKGDVDQALRFVNALHDLSSQTDARFPVASEACLSGRQLFWQLQVRIQALEKSSNLELQSFLEHTIKPLWQELSNLSAIKWPKSTFDRDLSREKQTLSLSDFGFHNAVRSQDGKLTFIDLEYFGLDDPVKLIADFLWHPAMDLGGEEKEYWLSSALKIFRRDPQLRERFRVSWPLYGLRWALIMLNEFRTDGLQKRAHADRDVEGDFERIKSEQLEKSRLLCEKIQKADLECPYSYV